MIVETSDLNSIKPFIKKLYLPRRNSHKGQNGRVLVIGGSSLFHAASIWAAEIASYFVDMIHYSSTEENNEIFLSLKKKFRNGIIVSKKHLLEYIKEDDAVLVGPGMIRTKKIRASKRKMQNYNDILKIKDEGEYTYFLTKFLINNFPNKRFIFDAGALQMMEPEWLRLLRQPAIITPHLKEFEELFNISIQRKSLKEKVRIAKLYAEKYKVVILLKTIVDIVCDGDTSIIIKGGNQGLTKGGTGDVLAGLVVAFCAKNAPLTAAVVSSFILKKAADELFFKKRYWYNINDLIEKIPRTLTKLIL